MTLLDALTAATDASGRIHLTHDLVRAMAAEREARDIAALRERLRVAERDLEDARMFADAARAGALRVSSQLALAMAWGAEIVERSGSLSFYERDRAAWVARTRGEAAIVDEPPAPTLPALPKKGERVMADRNGRREPGMITEVECGTISGWRCAIYFDEGSEVRWYGPREVTSIEPPVAVPDPRNEEAVRRGLYVGARVRVSGVGFGEIVSFDAYGEPVVSRRGPNGAGLPYVAHHVELAEKDGTMTSDELAEIRAYVRERQEAREEGAT